MLTRRQARLQRGETDAASGSAKEKPSRRTSGDSHPPTAYATASSLPPSDPPSWEPLRVSHRRASPATQAAANLPRSAKEEEDGVLLAPQRSRRSSASAFLSSLAAAASSSSAPSEVRATPVAVSTSRASGKTNADETAHAAGKPVATGDGNEDGPLAVPPAPLAGLPPHALSWPSPSFTALTSYYDSLVGEGGDGDAKSSETFAAPPPSSSSSAANHPGRRKTSRTTRAAQDTAAASSPSFPDFVVTPVTREVLRYWAEERETDGAFVIHHATPRTHHHQQQQQQSSLLRDVAREEGGAPTPAEGPNPGRRSDRVTATQAKGAWRGCVRELTSLLPSSPSSHVGARKNGGGGTGPATHGAKKLTLTVSASGRPHHTAGALAFQKEKQEYLLRIQSELTSDVHAHRSLAAHRERMRLLLSAHADNDDAGHEGGASEAAYLKLLNPSHSAKEANILRVISAIDDQLNAQLRSVYREREGTHQEPPPLGEERGAASHGGGRLTPRRRLELVDALVNVAVASLPPFGTMLMPYQQEGVRWFLHLNFTERMNGILADDMGLGKTAQSVLYMAGYKMLIEGLVERQLARLATVTQEVVRRAYVAWWCSSEGHPQPSRYSSSSSSTSSSHAAAEAKAREMAALVVASRALEEAGSVVLPELVALWPQLSAHSLPAETPPGSGGDGASQALERALWGQLSSHFAAMRTLKEIKQWVWQANPSPSEDGEAGETVVASPRSRYERSNSSSNSSMRQGTRLVMRPHSQQQQQQLPPPTARQGRRRTAQPPPPSVLLPRKRGRPSKADIAARAAAAAAAAAAASFSSPAHQDALEENVASAERAAAAFFDDAAAVPGLSRAADTALARYTPMLPILVIAPLSTLPHWQREFAHFGVSPLFEVYTLNGSRDARDAETLRFLQHVKIRQGSAAEAGEGRTGTGAERRRERQARHQQARQAAATEWDDDAEEGSSSEALARRHAALYARTPVLVIPHDLLVRQGLSLTQRRIHRVAFHLVLMDEAQRIKNSQGGLFRQVCRLSSLSRAVLTGTPLQNNMVELFALLQFLAPQDFHSKEHHALLEQLDAALAEASRSHALEDAELHILLCRRVHRLLSPFILRRDKSVIKAMLPPKKDYTVVCPLLPYQAAKLAEVDTRYQAGALSGNPSILRRKILLHPYTTLPYFYVDDAMLSASGKLLVLDFMMEFLQRTRHKFLIFCGWTLVLDVVETLCQVRRLPYVRLDGRTSVEDREANIASFNHPHPQDGEASVAATGASARGKPQAPICFLISKVAGGVGLNLQSADTVFLLDVDYNPQRDNQALSRVYRVGQRKEVRVYRLLIDHPSEQGVVAIHKAKEHLDKAVVQAGKYDLHTSAKEKEVALQRLFVDERGGQGDDHDEAIGSEQGQQGQQGFRIADIPRSPQPSANVNGHLDKQMGEEDVHHDTAVTVGSPSLEDPSSPVFPFGPPPDGSADIEDDADGSSTISARERVPPRPTSSFANDSGSNGTKNGDDGDGSRLPPVLLGAVTFPPPSRTPSSSPTGPLSGDGGASVAVGAQGRADVSPTSGKPVRRVRFALPEDEEAETEPVATEAGTGRKGKAVTFADLVDVGASSGRGEGMEAQTTSRQPKRRHRSSENGENGDDKVQHLAEYLLAMRERFHEVLPRSPGESAVLDAMLAAKTAEVGREREGKGATLRGTLSRRRRVE